MQSEHWAVDMGSGQWIVNSGQLTAGSGQLKMTVSSGNREEDRGQMTEDMAVNIGQ
jgi:hypothetical protein